MREAYPTFIAEDGSDYLVYVPDMDINTEGKSLADAIYMARDAIGLKGIVMEDMGQALPPPSTTKNAINKAKSDVEIFDYSKGSLTYVDVDFEEYRKKMNTKSVRRNVTLPNWLNIAAEEAGINVSGVLQEALVEKLGISKPY